VQPPDVAPANPGFTYPTEPSITLPDQPQLTELTIPDFVGLSLPTFDPTFPTFSESAINTVIDWTEPTYTEEVIDEVKTQITTFFAGGSGVNPLVEEAVMARGRDREDRQVAQSEQQAEEEWANRGYTAPPGLLVQRIDQIREEGLVKKLGLNRELVIKTHDDELANLRFAVQQGIAAEQLYVQMHLAAVERLFEVQRLAIQWAIDLYNTAVEIFNARMREVQIRAQVYETQVRGELAKVEAYKAQVDAELAKAEINKTLVEMYQAEIQARETLMRRRLASKPMSHKFAGNSEKLRSLNPKRALTALKYRGSVLVCRLKQNLFARKWLGFKQIFQLSRQLCRGKSGALKLNLLM
jgi:hypothetical protein